MDNLHGNAFGQRFLVQSPSLDAVLPTLPPSFVPCCPGDCLSERKVGFNENTSMRQMEWGKRSDRNFSDFGKNNGRDAGNHPFEARGRVSTRRAKLDEAWRGASAPMGSEPGEARAGSGASMMRQ